jgi:hypothetical protein
MVEFDSVVWYFLSDEEFLMIELITKKGPFSFKPKLLFLN